MENPMSWDDATKLIDEALGGYNHLGTSTQDSGGLILCALEKAGLLKKENSGELRHAVNDTVAKSLELINSGFCGKSTASTVKELLVNMGVL